MACFASSLGNKLAGVVINKIVRVLIKSWLFVEYWRVMLLKKCCSQWFCLNFRVNATPQDRSELILLKLDARKLQIMEWLALLSRSKNCVIMLVSIQCLFKSPEVVWKWGTLSVLVVVVAFKGRSWSKDPLVLFLVHNHQRVCAVEAIGSSYESPLFSYELLICSRFVGLVHPSAAKCWHSDVVCVHSSWHRVDESRFRLIHKAVDLVSILLDLLSSLNHFLILFAWHHWFWVLLPMFELILVNSTEVYLFLGVEVFDRKAFFNTITQRFTIVRLHLIILLSWLLGSLVAVF